MTSPAYDEYEFFASCLAGFEQYLADELKRLRGRRIRPLHGGVAFFGHGGCGPARVPVVSSGLARHAGGQARERPAMPACCTRASAASPGMRSSRPAPASPFARTV